VDSQSINGVCGVGFIIYIGTPISSCERDGVCKQTVTRRLAPISMGHLNNKYQSVKGNAMPAANKQ